jgi:NDP-sugar pyrophosphorylase family protein
MRSAIDTAIIMAGGLGMRLRPYTTVLPKPIMPLGGRPLLEILVRQLGAAGIREVVVSVSHLSHVIRAVLDNTDLSDARVRIGYRTEDRPLGTCGALQLMRADLPERFLVVNGDLLSDYPIGALLDAHRASPAALTIGTRMSTQSVPFGVIRRDADGTVRDYVEKPSQQHELSIGLYAMERSCVERFLTSDAPADMPDLIRALIAAEAPVQARPEDCTWIDIGHPDEYLRAQELFTDAPERFLPRATVLPGAMSD